MKQNLIILTLFLMLLSTGSVNADATAQISTCNHCHGNNGVSKTSSIPTIAGYSEYYVTDSMNAYKEKKRACPSIKYPEGPDKGKATDMCSIAKALDEKMINEIAAHYAALKFIRAKQSFDKSKAAHGKKLHELHCVKCHEDGGSSPDDDAGILAGQWQDYLKHTFEEYKSGDRPLPEKMKPKFDSLSDTDIDNLIQYYISIQ